MALIETDESIANLIISTKYDSRRGVKDNYVLVVERSKCSLLDKKKKSNSIKN